MNLEEYRKNLQLKPTEEWRRDTFIPFEQRKKVLLMSDDMRLPSGVGTVSKDIVIKTSHHFNWVQVGGAIKHPDQGKIIDLSSQLETELGFKTSVRIYPTDGYGDPNLLRYLINEEKPDAIMHFTDPRFWLWLYNMEHEVRQVCPLLFYAIWDDLPFPHYNENYYKSCDSIATISKQTYNIVKHVAGENNVKTMWNGFDIAKKQISFIETKISEHINIEQVTAYAGDKQPVDNKIILDYLPHGISSDLYKPLSIDNQGTLLKIKSKNKDGSETERELTEFSEMLEFKKYLFKDNEYDFVAFYNNRNIRRKMPGDVVLAFSKFVEMLPKEKRKKVALLMHTHAIDENGTDLLAVKSAIAKDVNVIFSTDKLDQRMLNYLYNLVDVTINMASNEGYGLGTAESLMAGTPVIVNVTGGLQDQCGFLDNKLNYLDPEKHFNSQWSSNHTGTYSKHGSWVKPIYPTNRALVGSPPTPYIFDDRCDWMDAANALKYWYDQSTEYRKDVGSLGRQFMFDTGMTANDMGLRFINYINTTLNEWKPRKRFSVYEY